MCTSTRCTLHFMHDKLSLSTQYLTQGSTDISIESEMNIQTPVTSLFGCACQDVAMCGQKTSLITVCELSVHSVALIPGGHTGFMLLNPHSSRSDMTLRLLLNEACLCLHAPRVTGQELYWVGMDGMQMKTGCKGQRVYKTE